MHLQNFHLSKNFPDSDYRFRSLQLSLLRREVDTYSHHKGSASKDGPSSASTVGPRTYRLCTPSSMHLWVYVFRSCALRCSWRSLHDTEQFIGILLFYGVLFIISRSVCCCWLTPLPLFFIYVIIIIFTPPPRISITFFLMYSSTHNNEEKNKNRIEDTDTEE